MSNNSSISLNQMSVNFIRGQLIYNSINWLAIFVDLVSALTSLLVLSHSKHKAKYRTKTFILLKLLFINSFLFSCCHLPVTTWHIYNGIFGVPELYKRRFCFLINQFDAFFNRHSRLLILLIGFDRLAITVRKSATVTASFNPIRPGFLISTASIVLGNVVLQTFFMSDEFADESPLIYCNLDKSLGKRFGLGMLFFSVLLTWLAFLLYFAMLIVVLFKQIHGAPDHGSTNGCSVDSVALKRARKITYSLTYYSTIIYLVTGPMTITCLVAMEALENYQLLSALGPSITWILYLESTFHTVSLLFMDDFRTDFLSLGKNLARVAPAN